MNRDRTKQYLLWWKKVKEMQEWNEQRMPKGAAWLQWRKVARKDTKEVGREEGEAKDKNCDRSIRDEIAQQVVANIKEKAGKYENAKLISQDACRQSDKQGWNCSLIESKEE